MTIWHMILKDFSKWFKVYMFVLLGFACSSYVLVVSYHIQEDIAEMVVCAHNY